MKYFILAIALSIAPISAYSYFSLSSIDIPGTTYVGDGICATSSSCNSWNCVAGYYYRRTLDLGFSEAENIENCYMDALIYGITKVQAISMYSLPNNYISCLIHPKTIDTTALSGSCTDGVLTSYQSAHPNGNSCPAESAYGRADSLNSQWGWARYDGAKPIMGTATGIAIARCYMMGAAPTAAPTPAPTHLITSTDSYYSLTSIHIPGTTYVGDGMCAISSSCNSWNCVAGYYYRRVYNKPEANKSGDKGTGFTETENIKNCAEDAKKYGAQGFTVLYVPTHYISCWIHPKSIDTPALSGSCTNGELSSWQSWASNGFMCPDESEYGWSVSMSAQWGWALYGGTGPIMGSVSKKTISRCYKLE